MRVSVITPVHNGGEWFRACMTSLAACDPPADEIIVIIDGEDDGSGEFAAVVAMVLLTTVLTPPLLRWRLGRAAVSAAWPAGERVVAP